MILLNLVFGMLATLYALLVRPGTQVVQLTVAPPRSAPTNTGVWFAVGLCDQGPSNAPVFIQSMTDFTRLLGARVSYSIMYDALNVFFREGGSQAYVGRVVGPAAAKATTNLNDAGAAVSLVVSALGPGAYGNNLKVGVTVTGGTYVIQVSDISNNILEQSPTLTTQADGVTYGETSQYITIALGASSNPPTTKALTAMTGGNDDRGNVTDAQWAAALALFSKDLGPGNVSAPGRTTDLGHTQLADHAAANNRCAILDSPDTPTQATVTASATAAKATGNGQYAAFFWPWIKGPGVVAGTTSVVPPCALVAGRSSAVDASVGPAEPAAGLANGVSSWAVDVSQPAIDDNTRQTWNTQGINVVRDIYGAPTIYGWRSLADPVNNPYWVPLGTGRYLMGLAARAAAVGEQYVFDMIDGQGHTIAAYGGALTSLVMADWNAGEIYGATSDQAFNVDVGPAVNTPAVLANNELRAVIAVRPSPMAELVTIEIVNTPITQAVA